MKKNIIPEWTEEMAIAALKENKQVMIEGLREQANGQKVYVEHEYARLRGVIVGNPNSTYLPDPFHPSWYTSFRSLPKDKLAWFAKNRGKNIREADPENWEKMAAELEGLAEVFRQSGAHVIQNKQEPPLEVINYTAGWLGQYGRHWAFHAQAFGEVFGNVIVNFHETQPSIRYNYIEYIEAFMGLIESDPEAVWMTMPDPMPMPTAFGIGLSPGDIRIFPNKLIVIGHGVHHPSHIKDHSKPRSSGNELGAEVLRRMLKPFGWRVEQVYFDANYGYHIDVLMPVIHEGLIAVGKNVLLTPLPKELQEWEIIEIDPEEYNIGAGNTTPLSSDSIIITADATKFIKDVEKRGVNVVPVPFSTVYSQTGSGIHCATFSYWRED